MTVLDRPRSVCEVGGAPPEDETPWPNFIDRETLRTHGVEDVDILRRALRAEDVVMSPERLRAAKASRLSATRRLVDRMVQRGWTIARRVDEIDARGEGLLIYDIDAEGWPLSFVVWASPPDSDVDRLGRFYEHVYDFYGSLFDCRVSVERARVEAERMRVHVWQGRTDNTSLGWTVANRSNRFFSHVVDALTEGRQPDIGQLGAGGGYIVRNAGWYGNGRHGSRSWLSLPRESPFAEPYFTDLFSLYLWRGVSGDVAESIAARRSEGAVVLSPQVRRYLGIGNSSGIGMVAALVRWPAWLATYCSMREVVRAFVVTRPGADVPTLERFEALLSRSAAYYAQQPPLTVGEAEQPAAIAAGLTALLEGVNRDRQMLLAIERPWAEIARRAAAIGSFEVEEQVTSLLMEVAPDFADAVASLMRKGMATTREIAPDMACGELLQALRRRYAWALAIDFQAPGAREHFWYKSEENGENRRGERLVDPGVENETFVNVAETAQQLERALAETNPDEPVGLFLLRWPDLAHMISRAQLAMRMPYTEIRANIIDRNFLPMDGIRLLLSVFGLEASSPYSTRWVRGVFLQGAPTSAELADALEPDWMFPTSARKS